MFVVRSAFHCAIDGPARSVLQGREGLHDPVERVLRHGEGEVHRPSALVPPRRVRDLNNEMTAFALQIGAFRVPLRIRMPSFVW